MVKRGIFICEISIIILTCQKARVGRARTTKN